MIDIPKLDSSYSEFDWSKWPNSRAALVEGTPTKQFERACWNDIVSTLGDLMEDAEVGWNSTYTDVPGAMIQLDGAHGKLYAANFNSIRCNLDTLIALPWQWAKNPTFRGYIGHKDMVGLSTVSNVSKADKLYPEYILLLVKRMNLLIRILRGDEDDLLYVRSEIILNEKWESSAASKRGAPGEVKIKVPVERSIDAVAKFAAPFGIEHLQACPPEVSQAAVRKAAPLAGEILIGVKHSKPEVIAIPKRKIWPLDLSIYANTGVQEGLSSREATPINLSARSLSEISFVGTPGWPVGVCASGKLFSNVLGTDLAAQQAASLELDGNTRTNADGTDIASQRASSVELDGKSTSTSEADLLQRQRLSAEVETKVPLKYWSEAYSRQTLAAAFSRISKVRKEASITRVIFGELKSVEHKASVIPETSVEYARFAYLGAEQLHPSAGEAEGQIKQISALLVEGKTHLVQFEVGSVATRRGVAWEAQRIAPISSGVSASTGKRVAVDVQAQSSLVSKSAEVASGVRCKPIADIQVKNSLRYETKTGSGRVDHVFLDDTFALTQAETELARAKPVATETTSIFGVRAEARLDDDLRPAPAGAETVAAISSMAAQIARKLPDGRLAVAQVSSSNIRAELGTAWLPPIWVGDGLHIRQVHDEPTLNDNGELVIT